MEDKKENPVFNLDAVPFCPNEKYLSVF